MRIAKPTTLKIAQGNPGKGPIAKDEPKPPLVTSPKCPETLSEGARTYWFRFVAILEPLGLLTVADLSDLAMMCELRQTFDDLVAEKATEADPAERDRLIRRANETSASYVRLSSLFGFTPAARVKLGTKTGASDDPFEEFKKKRGRPRKRA